MEGKVIFFISDIPYNELTLLPFEGWIPRKLECLPTEGSQLQWRGGISVIFETWAADQNQYLNLGSYRIRSNLWVHGTIGPCYPARDSKVETAVATTYHLEFLLLHILSVLAHLYSPFTSCLAQITKRWRCVQPRICLCGYHSGCQVLKNTISVNFKHTKCFCFSLPW